MKNVLVFPCGSEVGLEIVRALFCSKHFKLYGGSSVDDHGEFVCDNYISNIPFVDEPGFIEKLNAIIDHYSIDFIIPAHDSVVLKLAECATQLAVPVITSCPETCRVCRSKARTYETFKNILPVPNGFAGGEMVEFPVFLKPDVGQGSKGVYVANNAKDVEFFLGKDPSLLILEFLPGSEYTIDCFTDSSGQLLFAEGRQRMRVQNGISVRSKEIRNTEFQRMAALINATIPLQGAWFFQLKERAEGELVLMEIAPRIAGTMGLYRNKGVNFVELSLFDKMGIGVHIIRNAFTLEIDRALCSKFKMSNLSCESVYMDLDDTLILNGKVNASMMQFLYQSRNQGKKIILLTKHREDIRKSLLHYAISDALFDEIISVKDDEGKKDLIVNLNSIFIDDSFNERKTVSDHLKIPVFGVDAIEALLCCQ